MQSLFPYLRTAFLYALLWWVLILLSGWLLAPEWPFDWEHFCRYDAKHYEWIVTKGYNSVNVAFFPLFPLVWKAIGVGKASVIVVNGLIYLFSASLLAREFKIQQLTFALALSVPVLFFMWLPYAEPLFFMASALVIVGLRRDMYALLLIGLYLASIARPAYVILVPAIVLTDLTFHGISLKAGKRALGYVLITGIGLSTVAWIQWMDTGEWFNFFSVQSKWDNALRIPTLPLRTWGSPLIKFIDGAALFTGILAGLGVLRIWLQKRKGKAVDGSSWVLFSLLYLTGITLLVVMYRGGSLFSLNRFVYCTAFFFTAFCWWIESKVSFSWQKWGILMVSSMGLWMLFAGYGHIALLLKFLGLSLLISLPIFFHHTNPRVAQIAKWSFLILMTCAQVYLFQFWLWKEWVA